MLMKSVKVIIKLMFSTLLPKLISLTSEAGETIIALHKDNMDFIVKSDNTPLTQADKISHNLITETLKKNYSRCSNIVRRV